MGIYQWLSDQYFNSIRNGEVIIEKLYRQIRRVLLLYIDPAIHVEIYGHKMALPFSHELPKYLSRYPNYMRNLWLLAGLVDRKYPGAVAIDIGANVGDTVAVIRKESSLPVICIEGNELYLNYLKENIKEFDQVLIAPFYVGDENAAKLKVIAEQGTAKLVSTESGDAIGFKPLSVIYEEASFSARVGLIKVDTDGFDLKILLGSRGFLEQHHPILFFEYDPHLFDSKDTHQYQRLFRMLAEIGYQSALEFDNFGNFCSVISLADDVALEELTARYAGQPFGNFCDLAVFPAADIDIGMDLKKAYD
jgi:FkbM family methyltransferase